MSATTSQIFKMGKFIFDRLSTDSELMGAALKLAKRAAETNLGVLITGESGTGKNLLAQAIHNASPRMEKPCVEVNCTALSETLIESELFGHEKGAFTGADARRRGRFELADGGTLILDEIGDMSLSAQAKILRAVEYKQFERLGAEKTYQADVRLISVTNRNLDELVAQKRFREDLLYRLREIHIELPPLRQRTEDLPLLSETFVEECRQGVNEKVQGISPSALALLRCYAWPGNLRELKTVIRRAAMVAGDGMIFAEHLGLQIRKATEELEPVDLNSADLSLKEAEKRHIAHVLKITRGNKRHASRMLEISRNTLDKKIQDYGVDLDRLKRKGKGEGD